MNGPRNLRKRLLSLPIVSALTFCILAAAIGVAVAQMHHTNVHGTPPVKTAAKAQPNKKNSSSVGKTPTIAPTSTPDVSDADKQAAAHAAAQPITDACKLLTLSIAQQVLGGGAAAAAPGDTSSMQADDTSITTCAYTTGGDTIQLAVRKPSGSLGVSENATAFGSGRPADAVTVQGYGQSAYWDPGKHTLNVLGSNNWYIMSRSSNTQAACETVAGLLKTGF